MAGFRQPAQGQPDQGQPGYQLDRGFRPSPPATPATGSGGTWGTLGNAFNTAGSAVGKAINSANNTVQQQNAPPATGTQSGPGILEQWFNQRANGTDPAYEYALQRGTANINDQYAARGGYNSGAAVRSISDLTANLGAQRQQQLDALASGASGEHQRRLEDMFSEGTSLAGGQAGTAGSYDLAAGGAMSQAGIQAIELQLAKAGVDQKTRQGIVDTLTSLGKTAAGVAGGM